MVTISAPLPVVLLLCAAVALLTWGGTGLLNQWADRLKAFRAGRTISDRAHSRIDRFAPLQAPVRVVQPPVAIRLDDIVEDGETLGPRALRDRVAEQVAQHPEWSGEQIWLAAVRAGIWPMDGSYHQHIERNRARAYRLRKRGLTLLGQTEPEEDGGEPERLSA